MFYQVATAQPPRAPGDAARPVAKAPAEVKPAAPAAADEESTGNTYALPYLLVFLVIAMGLMVVCRPGRKRIDP